MLAVRDGIHKMLVRIANSEDPDLGLPCMSRPFWQATSVENFRAFTVCTVLPNFSSVYTPIPHRPRIARNAMN